jgi:hypothetical protein
LVPKFAGPSVGLLAAVVAARWVFEPTPSCVGPRVEAIRVVNPLLFMAAGVCPFDASQDAEAGRGDLR